MHLLPISLLAILAGTLLLAKTRKEELGKIFAFVSWFFIVVGFILFIGVICVETNGHKSGHPCCKQEMMMKGRGHGAMHGGMCCPANPGMCKGPMEKKENCMKNDSIMKSCPKHAAGDNSKTPGAK